MTDLPERAQPLHFGVWGLLELMGTTQIIPPKYDLNHLSPDPGKQTALKNNLSNRNKASYLDHSLQTQSRHQPATQTPFSVLWCQFLCFPWLLATFLKVSKIMLHTVPPCSFPPRGSKKDTVETWAQLIMCLCTGSACDILTVVSSIIHPSASEHPVSPQRQPSHTHVTPSARSWCLYTVVSSETTPWTQTPHTRHRERKQNHPTQHRGRKYPMQDTGKGAFWPGPGGRGWVWFLREGKSRSRARRGGGARGWLSATSVLLWSRGHAGRRPVPAVGCVNLCWPRVPPRRLGGSWRLPGSGTPSIFPSSHWWAGQRAGGETATASLHGCTQGGVSSVWSLLPLSLVCTSSLQ